LKETATKFGCIVIFWPGFENSKRVVASFKGIHANFWMKNIKCLYISTNIIGGTLYIVKCAALM
jgi:hypothetical protein